MVNAFIGTFLGLLTFAILFPIAMWPLFGKWMRYLMWAEKKIHALRMFKLRFDHQVALRGSYIAYLKQVRETQKFMREARKIKKTARRKGWGNAWSVPRGTFKTRDHV